jgi:CRP-like cAMP-binding protein
MAEPQDTAPDGADHDHVTKILKKKFKTQLELEFLDKKFEQVDFFKRTKEHIDEESFFKLLKSVQYEQRPANQILFRKGERGVKFYILIKGAASVRIHKQPDACKPNTRTEVKKIRRILDECDPNLSSIKTRGGWTSSNGRSAVLAGSFSQDFADTDVHEDPESGSPIQNNIKGGKYFPVGTLKPNRPFVKLAYWVTRHWHDS